MEQELFIGQQECTTDEKRRFSIPPKFRPHLDQERTPSGFIYHMVVIPWYGGALAVLPVSRWREIQARILHMEYTTQEFLEAKRRCLPRMEFTHTDPEGRLGLDPKHHAWIRLSPKGKDRVVVAGVGQHLEVWNATEWPEVERTGKNMATRGAEEIEYDKQLEILMQAAREAELSGRKPTPPEPPAAEETG